jgi:hypothetical protein
MSETNYHSGDDYVVEFLGYRFSFNQTDFEQRVNAAAVKLGFFAFLAKLFAKGGKIVVAVLAGLAALGAKFWNALRGKAGARAAPRPGSPEGGV